MKRRVGGERAESGKMNSERKSKNDDTRAKKIIMCV